MSGKDLLAVLVMIAPSFLLIALIAISTVPSANFVEARPASGQEGNNHARKTEHAQAATQKRMHDPWKKPDYAKTADGAAR